MKKEFFAVGMALSLVLTGCGNDNTTEDTKQQKQEAKKDTSKKNEVETVEQSMSDDMYLPKEERKDAEQAKHYLIKDGEERQINDGIPSGTYILKSEGDKPFEIWLSGTGQNGERTSPMLKKSETLSEGRYKVLPPRVGKGYIKIKGSDVKFIETKD